LQHFVDLLDGFRDDQLWLRVSELEPPAERFDLRIRVSRYAGKSLDRLRAKRVGPDRLHLRKPGDPNLPTRGHLAQPGPKLVSTDPNAHPAFEKIERKIVRQPSLRARDRGGIHGPKLREHRRSPLVTSLRVGERVRRETLVGVARNAQASGEVG